MLIGSASLAMSTSILKALPILDIKIHSPSILYVPIRRGLPNVLYLSKMIDFLERTYKICHNTFCSLNRVKSGNLGHQVNSDNDHVFFYNYWNKN